MALSPSNSLSEPAIIEQVITEFFAKSLHIILESRSPYVSSRNYSGDPFVSSSPASSSSSSSGRPRDKWFNLALRDCPAALENFDLWRQSNLEPLVVDVVLARRSSGQDAGPARPYPGGCLVRTLSAKDPLWPSTQDDFVSEAKSKKIIERWIVQYEARKSAGIVRESYSGSKKISAGSSSSSEIPALYKKTYKKTIVLLRSLYATIRLLPAYKVFRALTSSGQICPISLSHRISSFVEPFTRAEDAEMNQFSFAPIDTPCGRLSLSVSYLPTLEELSSEPSAPLSTHLITDYVGSPTTDPVKRFTRHHSWSIDRGGIPLVSPSPSPTFSDSRALRCNLNPRTPPPDHSHDQSPYNTCSATLNELCAQNTSFDGYWPSPPFSPSSSPSPPTHFHSGHLPLALLRSESAPVSVPLPRLGKSSGLLNHELLPPPSRKVTKPGYSSQGDALRAQVTTGSASQASSTESKLRIKKESPRFLEFKNDSRLQKLLSFGRDDIANLSGLCSSPRIPFSRSPSRLTFLDEFEDSEFAFPFAVDDEDLTDSRNRIKPSDVKDHESGISEYRGFLLGRMSPDAAIGAIVRMFKAAPPLQRNLSNSVRTVQVSRDEIWNERIQYDKDMEVRVQKLDNAASSSEIAASGLLKSKTAADALLELRSYKEMKELLLTQGGLQSIDNDCAAESAVVIPKEL